MGSRPSRAGQDGLVRGAPRLIRIDDPTDPRVADYVALTDAELRRGDDVCIAEGVTVIRHLVAVGVPLRSVLVTPAKAEAVAPLPDDVTILVASQAVMNAVVGFDIHRGAVAVAERPPTRDVGTVVDAGRALVVLEGISDVENMGLLFRNAAALGADAVLLSPTCCDPLYRRSLRVSMGHALSIPFATLDPWPGGLDRVRGAGFEIVALTPAPDADPITAVSPGARTAVLLGAEGPGLTAAALAAADRRVRIPMRAGVDSLNVAAAAAIAFHRLFRGDGLEDVQP